MAAPETGAGGEKPAAMFGKFELVQRIAVGGMAEIFLARSTSLGGLNRFCVIKRILPEYSFDRQFVSMFIDEARITIGLDHPNIVRLLDFGQHAGTYFMAMEYVDGFDLVDILRLHKRMGGYLPIEACAFVAREMLRGLHHAHVQKDYRGLPLGIVHRDVSPHNVLVSSRGDVKIADFGIASARHKLTVTQAGTLKGKFAYMAPEQSTGAAVDARADLWAVGVTLFEMLTSSRLFACDNPIATIGKVLNAEIPNPASRRPEIPAAVGHIVKRSLERDLARRYPTAKAMADDLDAFLVERGYDTNAFARFLSSLEWTEDTAPARRVGVAEPFAPLPSAIHRRVAHQDDPEVQALLERFRRECDVWVIHDVAELHLKRGDVNAALDAMRTAAAVFASRALLVQSICAFAPAKAHLSPERFRRELAELAALRGKGQADLRAYFQTHEHGGLADVIDAVEAARSADEEERTFVFNLAPLFSRLAENEYVRLVEAITIHRVAVGTPILAEGQAGSSLFALGRGRVVVSCLPSSDDDVDEASRTVTDEARGPEQKVYLSALSDGDFFGEFSYLTGRPRSATVEAITDCVVLEISPAVSERLLQADPAFRDPLLEFYKERVGELMMAKNPVFSVLPHEDRRELLGKSELQRFRDQERVVRQGDIALEMFFIKHGEVEVYRDEDGLPVFINKLREGDFFGEMAAVHGTPRSASVRAMGDIEVFCMRQADLNAILEREPRLRELIEVAIEKRANEATARLLESRAVFAGT